MRKIKKADPRSAQSVYAFYCPCRDGACAGCGCDCIGNQGMYETGRTGADVAIDRENNGGTVSAFT